MSQSGYTPISLYYSSTASAVPTAGNLVNGELALNNLDGKLFYKDSSGVVQVIAGKGGAGVAGGSNTQVQYNSSGSLAGSANMVFDGSTLTTLNSAYTGTLTGGTGVVNLGSGQFYKDASGNVGIGLTSIANVYGWSKIVGIGGTNPTVSFQNGTSSFDIANYQNELTFWKQGSGEVMAINSSLNLRVDRNIGIGGATPTTSGTGITFPATQSASSDANTLDDYEEGTWTPSWTGGITSSNTTYTKIGRVVYVSGQITATGATSGDLSGLPFGSIADGSDCGSVGYQNVNSSTWNVLKTASTTFRFYAGGTQQQFTASGNNARFAFSYITS